MSTSCHPYTDGASEIINKMGKSYLRCCYSYHQYGWDELLPAAKFAYSSALSEDLEMSPFERNPKLKSKTPLDLISGKKSSKERERLQREVEGL